MARSALAVGTSLEKVAVIPGWKSDKVLEIAKKVKIVAAEVMNPFKEISNDDYDEYDFNESPPVK